MTESSAGTAIDRGGAIVTGAARGIGRAIAVCLAESGFDVALVDREPQTEAEPGLEAISALGRQAAYVEADIADLDGHAALLDAAAEALGSICCLVNNAGVTSLQRGDMLELAPESFDRCVAVNLRGTYFLTQAVARRMLDAGPDPRFRSIVTISSANVEVLGPTRADYCMTKAALAMMSKLYAARLAEAGIAVFEIQPGIIRTDMTAPATERYDDFIAEGGVPMKRWGTPEDVGRAAATLARGDLPFDTGDAIRIGGGMHLLRV